MTYKKPAEICMSLFGGPSVCNDDPILRFIPLEQFGDIYWSFDEPSGNLVDSLSGFTLVESGAGKFYSEPSLRADNAGSSVRYTGNNSAHSGTFSMAYANGFTVEVIVNAISPNFRSGTQDNKSIINGVNSILSDFSQCAWVLRFDNYDDTTDADVHPTFTLVSRNAYSKPSNRGLALVAEVRSPSVITLNKTYHLLATIRPSNNTIELWLNGVSIGSASFPSAWFDYASGTTTGSPSLLDGTRNTVISVGGDSTSTVGGENDYGADDVKIHFLEADDAFALAQAARANFT